MESRYKYPNFLVIGAEKSGTTWLYNKLRQHPEVYLPLTKECHFFNSLNSNLTGNENYNNLGWDWYRRFFEDIPEQVKAAGEVTPMYICDPDASRRIARDLPDVKLIYILRNPVTRAYSHYWMARRKGNVEKSFEKIVTEKDPRFIERGKYAKQLEKYYDLFPPKNLRGYIYETFFQNPEKGLKDVYSFLNLEEQNSTIEVDNQKVHAAQKPKSRMLQNLITKSAKKLRKNPITFGILDWLKASGIAPAIKHWNSESEPYPPISESLFYELLEYYREDMNLVKEKWRFETEIWEDFNSC